jgi:hypothetical protein
MRPKLLYRFKNTITRRLEKEGTCTQRSGIDALHGVQIPADPPPTERIYTVDYFYFPPFSFRKKHSVDA